VSIRNLGEQPRPRVLFKLSRPLGGRAPVLTAETKSVAQAVKEMVGTFRLITSPTEVRLEEWDACLHFDPWLNETLLESMPCFCPAAKVLFQVDESRSLSPDVKSCRPTTSQAMCSTFRTSSEISPTG
jgi:hypothetical protein